MCSWVFDSLIPSLSPTLACEGGIKPGDYHVMMVDATPLLASYTSGIHHQTSPHLSSLSSLCVRVGESLVMRLRCLMLALCIQAHTLYVHYIGSESGAEVRPYICTCTVCVTDIILCVCVCMRFCITYWHLKWVCTSCCVYVHVACPAVANCLHCTLTHVYIYMCMFTCITVEYYCTLSQCYVLCVLLVMCGVSCFFLCGHK